MMDRLAEEIRVILLAIVGGALLFFWSVPSSLDFLMRIERKWERNEAQR
jgi:hypothetical protein